MEFKKEVVLRTIADETMLIPVGADTKEYNGIFSLTESAVTAFKAIQSGKEKDEIVDAILEEFDIDRPTAERDVDDFLTKLKNYGII